MGVEVLAASAPIFLSGIAIIAFALRVLRIERRLADIEDRASEISARGSRDTQRTMVELSVINREMKRRGFF